MKLIIVIVLALVIVLPAQAAILSRPLTKAIGVKVYSDPGIPYAGETTGKEIFLKPWVISASLAADERATLTEAKSVYVIAHELGHVKGAATEETANAYAAKHYFTVAKSLHASLTQTIKLWKLLPYYWRNPSLYSSLNGFNKTGVSTFRDSK
jgi:hypothetical protein